MDADLRRLERAAHADRSWLGGDDIRLERARLRSGFAPAVSLDDFIRQDSSARAHGLVRAVAARTHDGNVFLAGPSGTGKTLLLRALYAARPDAWLWSGLDLVDRAARALERGELLDAPRLLIVDDLTSFPPGLGELVRRSLHGRTFVAAGSRVHDAALLLGGDVAVVEPLEWPARRELFRRAQRRLGAPDSLPVPDDLPRSGFEVEGLARNLALRAMA